MLKIFQLLCLTYLISFSNFGLTCTTYMAKIHLTEQIGHVMIWRAHTKNPEWASHENRYLCKGDVVFAPKTLSNPIIIEYYTNNPPKQEKLTAGEDHEIAPLPMPCGAWCKWQQEIKQLYHNLTHTETLFGYNAPIFGRGKDGELYFEIFMPLAAGEGNDYEFFLFAQPGEIPLFWHGGAPPYQLKVKDAQNRIIIKRTVYTNHTIITLNTAINQRYDLSISCQDCQVYRKPLLFLAPPPSPFENKLKTLGALALNEEKNWRLEIWRQLAKMPKNQARDLFRQVLTLSCLDEFSEKQSCGL